MEDENEYEFTITLFGTGADVDEAWEQARDRVFEGDLPKFDTYKEWVHINTEESYADDM